MTKTCDLIQHEKLVHIVVDDNGQSPGLCSKEFGAFSVLDAILHIPGLVQSTILYSVPTATRVIRAAHQLITNMITRQTAEPSNATHFE